MNLDFSKSSSTISIKFETLLLFIGVLDFKYFFLQPKDEEKNRTNILKTINYCKSHKPWFPSFQIHKSLGIN